MKNDVLNRFKPLRFKALPIDVRETLIKARSKKGWSQRDLASQLGITQTHISSIESGKIVPRYDTLLEIVRMLDNDIIIVPRELTPIVQSLVRHNLNDASGGGEEQSLYANNRQEDKSQESYDEV
jgi:transcriptional regulator with XRE-family HTH domain